MRRILFKEVGEVIVDQVNTSPIPDGAIRVKHQYSLISAGTELLKLQGFLGKLDHATVGYSGVGKILGGFEGTGFQEGEVVFTRGPHADIVDVPIETAKQNFIRVEPALAKQATFLELGKVALHGLHRVEHRLGDWVAVFGLGIVGNLCAQLAMLAAGRKVIGVEPIAGRRQVAQALGIRTLDPRSGDFVAEVRKVTGGGAEVVLETSGSQEALTLALQIAALRGQIAVIAGHYGTRELDFKTDFQNKELSLIGARRLEITERSMVDRWTVSECREEFYRMVLAEQVRVDPLITHCVRPEQAPEIYERLRQREDGMLGVMFDWT